MRQSNKGPEGISGYFIGNSQATNDDFSRVAAVWQCFVRASKNKTIDNTYPRGSSVFFKLLLFLRGDIEAKLGQWKFPCGICSTSVKSNQMGIQCDECEQWFHVRPDCCDLSHDMYEMLANSS